MLPIHQSAVEVKYDIVHMRDQAFSKQPLNKFGSLPKNDP